MQDPDPVAYLMAQIANSVHPIAPVSWEPHDVMETWRLYQVRDQHGARQRHLVGTVQGGRGEGRVTSALVRIDLASSMAETSSGRLYSLKGESRYDSDADYVRVYGGASTAPHMYEISAGR